MKSLIEKRNRLISEMTGMLDKAEQEERAFSTEEEELYTQKMTELENLEKVIKHKEELRAKTITKKTDPASNEAGGEEEERAVAQAEERAFESFLRTGEIPEERAEGATNMTMGANGAVIPLTIAKRIIRKFEEICPIYQNATKFHFKGNVDFPVINEDSDTVVMDYAEEFAEVESHVMIIDKVRLGGYLASALAVVSKSLINNSEIDIVSIVITQMAIAHKRFTEKELLHGTEGKMTGAFSTENKITTASQTALTSDDLIRLQGKVKSPFQPKAVWYMSENTRDAIRMLKDADGKYLLEWDFKEFSGGRLLGKPVVLSEQIDDIGAGKDVILYGDLSGLYVNLREAMEILILKEKYATQHAIGINTWVEMDSKIVEPQKFGKLTMAG